MMRLLCSLDYARAVIVQQTRLNQSWTKILFSHQEPMLQHEAQTQRKRTPWPEFQPASFSPGKPIFDLQHIIEPTSECVMQTDFRTEDLQALFRSGVNCLCTDFDIPDLPDFVRQALRRPEDGQIDLTRYERLLIFTDGSSQPAGRRLPPVRADEEGLNDTWAFLVMGERRSTSEHEGLLEASGWTAQPVSYNVDGSAYTGVSRIGSDQAERAAMTFAGIWRLTQNVSIQTVLCTDSSTTGKQAMGLIGTAVPDASYRLMRGVFQALQFALGPNGLLLHHTKSHAGDPYNEFVDFIAKRESASSFHHRRQQLDLRQWAHRLEHIWMIFGQDYGLPKWKDGGFDVPAPQLPPESSSNANLHNAAKRSHAHIAVQSQFCVATANVQSLSRSPDGHGGKIHYLYAQMKHFQLNCLALQETRTEAGVRCSHNILCFASGCAQGHLGIEIWFNLDQAIGWHRHRGRHHSYKLQKSNFVVTHADPRRLLLRCDHPLLDCWILAAHAPHSGRSTTERMTWWHETMEVLRMYHDQAPMIWLLDANAPPGEPDGITVHRSGFATSANTALFREALQEWQLCLPATTECHIGSNATWTSIDGLSQHCIDHVAVPIDWLHRCTISKVEENFDLAQSNEDHKLVALQLEWRALLDFAKQHKKQSKRIPADFQDPQLRQTLLQTRPAAWHEDVEHQAESLVQQLHVAMQNAPSRQAAQAKKPYVTEQVWSLRMRKLQHRQLNKSLRRSLAREALYMCFHAWSTKRPMSHPDEVHQYGTTLRCIQVKSVCGFYKFRKLMKILLQRSKQALLNERLQQLGPQTPASTVLAELKPFIGPTNPQKQKRRTLPLIHNESDQPCTLPNEALETWINFFRDMEGGRRVDHSQLRTQWLDALREHRQEHLNLDVTQVPTLTDMEIALRRVPCRKATGPDDIPGEMCHFNADLMAPLCYTQMLKVLLHGQEPLLFKGGLLTPAFKGKGPAHQVSSFRSLLVSSHLGKVIHRCIRQHTADVYEHFLQAQQLGGRRKVPVQLALHQARAFLRNARQHHRSAGLLFLDLTEAFYRILRELSLGGVPTDELICHVFRKLQLPNDSMHRLHDLLEEGTALAQAGLSNTARNCFKAIHSNTHFWLPGQHDVVATALGTRPGDSFADTIFGFTWGLVLKKLEAYLIEHDLIANFAAPQQPPFFSTATDEMCSDKPFLGPTWMDDLCLCLQHAHAQGLEHNVGPAVGYLLDLCDLHMMSPNLRKGKTELMLCFNGPGSRALRVRHYGPQASGSFSIVCENQMKSVLLTKHYRHLGGQLHHTGDQATDVTQKLAVGHGAFNMHRKLLYHNQHITLQHRSELFNTLVLTKVMYGADTWIAKDQRTMKKFEAAIFRLYRRLLKVVPMEKQSDLSIIAALELPTPEILLRRARLRYLSVLFRCEVPDIWHLLGADQSWVQLIEDDLMWMWSQLSNSSNLQNPAVCPEQWFDLLCHHPSYWKRLLARACVHHTLQIKKNQMVIEAHQNMRRHLTALSEAYIDPALWQADDFTEPEVTERFGCMSCGLACRNRAGEAAHMFRKHGIASIYRGLVAGTQCEACLKECHTHGKVKAHLHYSTACRRILLSRNHRYPLGPGKGSEVDQRLEKEHDRMLPPLQAQGPFLPPQGVREFQDIHDGLYMHLVDYFAEEPRPCVDEHVLKEVILRAFEQWAISWTCTTRTLGFFMDNLEMHDAEEMGFDLEQVRAALCRLCQADSWSFLQHQCRPHGEHDCIKRHHAECSRLADLLGTYALPKVPRVFGRHRIILHAFAGRRRLGDFQYFIEQEIAKEAPYIITVVSVDVVINQKWGDIASLEARQLWLNAIYDKMVMGFIAGPPCETWSRVRGVADRANPRPQGRQPRVLRDETDLWGFACLAVSELQQILTGNLLLGFCLQAMLLIAIMGGVGLLEHPAEPLDLPGAASIWKLPIMQVLMQLSGVRRVKFAQGLMGARTAKPTELLCINLPQIISFLHAQRVRKDLPAGQAVGRDAHGGWKTAPLKEYPPALCKAMANSFLAAFDSCDVAAVGPTITPDFHALCQSMQVHDYGDFIGHDYKGG